MLIDLEAMDEGSIHYPYLIVCLRVESCGELELAAKEFSQGSLKMDQKRASLSKTMLEGSPNCFHIYSKKKKD